MKNALIACTVGCFLRFELNDISILQDMGYTVHVATNFNGYDEMHVKIKEMNVVIHQVDFARSPFSKQTINAYRQLKRIMREKHFDLIHCHTPVGGVLTRLSANKYHKKGLKILYTAHGFHFFKGAPLKNWLLYYPVEWICSWMTDVLITINQEDYKRAKEKFHAKRVEYISGVGIDLSKFNSNVINVDKKRNELGVKPDEILLLSVGELNQNKNHELVIRAIYALDNPKIRYFIAGNGDLKDYLENLIHDLGLESQVRLLGYRNDVAELYQVSDLFVFPSKREGLSVALMEAIASKVPVMCSDIRGNKDLIKEYLFDSKSVDSLYMMLKETVNTREEMHQLMNATVLDNYQKLKEFSLPMVSGKMLEIYENVLHS